MEKPARTQSDIHPLIRSRWSARALDASRSLSEEQLLALKEAAHWAPSCYGDAPWRFLFCNRDTAPEAWEKVFASLMDLNKAWAKNAPLLVVAAAVDAFRHNGSPNRWSQYDAGAASENLCLQASALNLVAHQMGGFKAEALRESFGIPANVAIMAVIAVGHPARPEAVFWGDMLERELASRQRPPLENHFFDGEWKG